jgi:hypothetical protein
LLPIRYCECDYCLMRAKLTSCVVSCQGANTRDSLGYGTGTPVIHRPNLKPWQTCKQLAGNALRWHSCREPTRGPHRSVNFAVSGSECSFAPLPQPLRKESVFKASANESLIQNLLPVTLFCVVTFRAWPCLQPKRIVRISMSEI